MRLPCLALAAALALSAVVGCVNSVEDEGAIMGAVGFVSEEEKAFTATCAPGPTVKGIDVSYWQGNINWASVAGDGVKYAFIRVSDGLNHVDTKFERNWDGAKNNGVLRGAYQYFRANQDPIAQANLLISKMGTLGAGDLPPVIDVESADGRTPAQIASKVKQWLDHVEARTGVKPIVYTGPYFWRDQVGGADERDSRLWIAHYGTSCPYVPPRWTMWSFHQHSSSGHVAGISGNVDMNKFSGTLQQLRDLQVAPAAPPPPPPPPPPTTPTGVCAPLEAAGGVIDDGDPCFIAGGPTQWLRTVSAGQGGDLITTGTTASPTTTNFAEWELSFREEGTYEIEVYIDAQNGTARQARYRITHVDGSTDAVIDQNASAGWVSIGAYTFRTGGGQRVRLNDNTGEHSSLNRDLVFDAVRVTRLDDSEPEPPPPPPDPCPRIEVFGTGSVLNVRPQANTQLAAIGQLNDGDIVDRLSTVTGQAVDGNTTWYRITDGQVTGYISGRYSRCHS